MDESRYELKLPGFRFHPTEEELLNFYLKSIVFGKKLCGDVIGLLNIYNYDPRELPGLAKIGEREWYFFVPIERKRGSGGRPNRTTENGYWKATGLDRKIQSVSDPKKILGLKKTLVFYEGRAPRGRKTEWIMNEYRLPEKCSPPKDIVLCKIYMKATTLKVSEQRASMEEEEEIKTTNPSLSSMDSLSFYSRIEETNVGKENMGLKKEREEKMMVTEESGKGMASSGLVLPNGLENLGELQLPKPSMDWTQDSFWTQFSPWLDNFTPFFPMC